MIKVLNFSNSKMTKLKLLFPTGKILSLEVKDLICDILTGGSARPPSDEHLIEIQTPSEKNNYFDNWLKFYGKTITIATPDWNVWRFSLDSEKEAMVVYFNIYYFRFDTFFRKLTSFLQTNLFRGKDIFHFITREMREDWEYARHIFALPGEIEIVCFHRKLQFYGEIDFFVGKKKKYYLCFDKKDKYNRKKFITIKELTEFNLISNEQVKIENKCAFAKSLFGLIVKILLMKTTSLLFEKKIFRFEKYLVRSKRLLSEK